MDKFMRKLILYFLLFFSSFGYSQNLSFDFGASNTGIPYKADLSMYIHSRSGLTMPDDYGNNATILPAYLYKGDGNETLYVYDNGSLDIGSSSLTLAGWVKGETASNPSGLCGIFGKEVNGSKNGRYGIYVDTDGKYKLAVQSSGGSVSLSSTVLITDQAWHFMVLTINVSTKKIQWFIDNTQIGTDASYTGTFSAPGNGYAFCIGCMNASAGNSVLYGSATSYSDVYVYHSLLSSNDQTALYNRGYVSGAAAHYPFLGSTGAYEYDASGNNYHLTNYVGGTTYAIVNTSFLFSSYGSRHGLDVGYTKYEIGLGGIYIPYTDAGNPISNPPLQPGATLVGNFAGNLTAHNLCNSKIAFTNTFWDRSNATIWTSAARSSETFYDSTSAIPLLRHCKQTGQKLYRYSA